MAEGRGILPGLPAVAGKPVHVGFDGGRLTSDGGILLLSAVEQRLKIAERLAACLEDPRDPERVWHELADMIRFCHGPQYVNPSELQSCRRCLASVRGRRLAAT
jgi:hypothetical protein